MRSGIIGYGTYVPKYRIKREEIARVWRGRARGENSIAGGDEDAITMAVEAAFNAIYQSGVDPAGGIEAVYLGTTSAPYIEHSLVGVIADTLGVNPYAEQADFGLSPRAGVSALKACLDAIQAKRIGKGLVIGSDCRSASPGSDQELTFGAGAAAYILGAEKAIVEVEALHSYSSYFQRRLDEQGPPLGRHRCWSNS